MFFKDMYDIYLLDTNQVATLSMFGKQRKSQKVII